jgi:sialate O-acetylesterase
MLKMPARLTVLLALLTSHAAAGSLRLAEVFTDGVVLQRQTEAPVWGWAEPGTEVVLRSSWKASTRAAAGGAGDAGEDAPAPVAGDPRDAPADAGTVVKTLADRDGLWIARLPTAQAGGPHTLEVSAGEESVLLRDILLGEVWLCSGQSNMEWPLKATTDAQATIAAADDPRLRFFVVSNAIAARPGRTFPAPPSPWRAITPTIAPDLSAVAYHFGRTLRSSLDVPVGLICAEWGGTPIQAWMPIESLRPFERFAPELAALAVMDPDPVVRERRMAGLARAWWETMDDRPDAPGRTWIQPGFDDSQWTSTVLPGAFSGPLASFDGVVYYRRTFDLPPGWSDRRVAVELGPIDDRDEVFVNGVLIGATREDGRWSHPRSYEIRPGDGVLRSGVNTIAVRVLDTAGPGGVHGDREQLRLRRDDGAIIRLAGNWKMLVGPTMASLPPMSGAPRVDQRTPSTLYNGMIAPLIPMALRGVVWYQGESNRDDPALYAQLFPAMIRAWRERFGEKLAFHFVQIAPFAYSGDRGETAALREAQQAALELAGTGMVVTLDVGDPADIHPRDKRTVGERLARGALADLYGASSGHARSPRMALSTVEGDHLRVHFDQTGGSLAAGPEGLVGFAIAGEDRQFFIADAVIDGQTVVLSSPLVPNPVAARYAWSAAPSASLFGAGGLPVAPFRTDSWARPQGGWPAAEDGGRTQHLSSDPAFVPLFDGRSLDGWTSVNCAPGTWTVSQGTAGEGLIHCTGIPTGVLRTNEMHENFQLELEWRHHAPQGNAGLFVWSDALPVRGQPFTRSIEVQVMVGSEGDWFTSDGDIFPIQGATMTPENGRGRGSRAFPTERRMKPAGEWNHYLVTCENGAISLAVNGKIVTRGRECVPRKGYICLESEGTPIDFRNIRLRPLPPASPAMPASDVAAEDRGFRPLYNGVDLAGWSDGVNQANHWQPRDWVLSHDGKGGDLWTDRPFRDFQLIVDWRLPRTPTDVERPLFGADGLEARNADGSPSTTLVPDAGDSGIYLRGSSKSQVNIWCWPAGSGEVYGYRTDSSLPAGIRAACAPRVRADRPLGEWNRFLISMKGDRLTVELNGVVVIEDAQLPDVPAEGPIGLQSHGDPVEFANLYIREL